MSLFCRLWNVLCSAITQNGFNIQTKYGWIDWFKWKISWAIDCNFARKQSLFSCVAEILRLVPWFKAATVANSTCVFWHGIFATFPSSQNCQHKERVNDVKQHVSMSHLIASEPHGHVYQVFRYFVPFCLRFSPRKMSRQFEPDGRFKISKIRNVHCVWFFFCSYFAYHFFTVKMSQLGVGLNLKYSIGCKA